MTWTQEPLTGSWWSEGNRFLIEWNSERLVPRAKVRNWTLYDHQIENPNERAVGRGKVSDLKRQANNIIVKELRDANSQDAEAEARWRGQGKP